ncbi:MAG: ABC transporter substrate-binding protein [Ideonella sp.]|nr:ABC transporter substrate-binding protein [Ideonella sp.]MBL0150850.1 ABC transporter substrate-binding protein [Ideonella sp.]
MRAFRSLMSMVVALAASAPAVQAQQVVNALCSTDLGWCELAAKEFQAATGIKVNQTRKATGEALAQIRSEAANPKTDLWWGGTGDPFLQAAELGLLEAYRPAYLDDLHGWSVRQYAMSGNMVGGFYTSAIGFGWNEEILKKKKLPAPRCWADLIDPKYKGEIETSHPASSGTAYTILAGLVQQMGEDKAFDYLKKLHRNVTAYTRSGQAQAKNVSKGEVAIGISFIFGFENERHLGFKQVQWAAPCEGTSYEIGGIALVKGARNKDTAKRYYDWLMSPAGQGAGARADALQVPANRTFKPDPRIPPVDSVRLIKYDFEKYGKAAERKRLIDRWEREVNSQAR